MFILTRMTMFGILLGLSVLATLSYSIAIAAAITLPSKDNINIPQPTGNETIVVDGDNGLGIVPITLHPAPTSTPSVNNNRRAAAAAAAGLRRRAPSSMSDSEDRVVLFDIPKNITSGTESLLSLGSPNSHCQDNCSGGVKVETTDASPWIVDCLQLTKNIQADGDWDVEADGQHQIAQHRSCAFGVTVTHKPKEEDTHIGNLDIIYAINALLKANTEIDPNRVKVGGTCDWICGDMPTNWGVYWNPKKW
ncbi:putative necrosis-inducing factor-domain-containing protein [Podospora australis]|uniref:Necrosis-inducing factor-domain-containing protein n=1 Tax=Podospora australis TaxID=1536484 RepID=A0AAN7AB81_9PEZI|nr:putative necrosis-inducing factor-domain-containing protein [Podospora australis]